MRTSIGGGEGVPTDADLGGNGGGESKISKKKLRTSFVNGPLVNERCFKNILYAKRVKVVTIASRKKEPDIRSSKSSVCFFFKRYWYFQVLPFDKTYTVQSVP